MGWLVRHTTSRQRNVLGCVVAFFLGSLFNVLGVAVMVWRELYQASRGKFPLEMDDVSRYSNFGLLGCVVNLLLIFWIWLS